VSLLEPGIAGERQGTDSPSQVRTEEHRCASGGERRQQDDVVPPHACEQAAACRQGCPGVLHTPLRAPGPVVHRTCRQQPRRVPAQV
jgi:hypothetical protein